MLLYHKKTGNVKAFRSLEIASSRIGIGFEKLDRAVFDPSKAYDKVAATGVKWARIQSGWQRTETEPGVYHFEWLDEIVENLLKRGVQPWVCLCYGNKLYDPEAGKRFGAVGCPPQTPEQVQAWKNYVSALVRHFEGRVTWWEIWNEPDCNYSWRYNPNPLEYTELVKQTSAAVRAASPTAKIIGGAFGSGIIHYSQPCFENGFGDACDAVSFHTYYVNETLADNPAANLKNLIRKYNSSLKLIQGEGGCQSRHDGCGAFQGQAWTEEKQVKHMARNMISRLGEDVMFTSYFSCIDMIEALNGRVGDKASYLDYGYFGILRAEFDDEGFSTGTYSEKPSYRTLQVLASIFRDDFEIEEPILAEIPEWHKAYASESCRLKDIRRFGFRRKNGAFACAYWKPVDLLSETYESMTNLTFTCVPPGIPRLIDVADGSVYEIDPKDVVFNPTGRDKSLYPPKNDGSDTIRIFNLPVLDHPLILDFGSFCEVE